MKLDVYIYLGLIYMLFLFSNSFSSFNSLFTMSILFISILYFFKKSSLFIPSIFLSPSINSFSIFSFILSLLDSSTYFKLKYLFKFLVLVYLILFIYLDDDSPNP